jgi:hypothetical protein
MYLRVMTLDGERVSVAQDELGVFEELKSFAFVPHTMPVEAYIQELAKNAWTFYGKVIEITGDTLAEKAKSAYGRFVELGLLIEITKEEALEHFGLTQTEADKMNIPGLRSID